MARPEGRFSVAGPLVRIHLPPAQSQGTNPRWRCPKVVGAVAPITRLVPDDWPSYNDIPDIKRKAITVGPMVAHIALPLTHRLFSNLKRWGLGVYHGPRKTTSSITPTSSCSASIAAGRGLPRSIRSSAQRAARPNGK
jgi:hypothetical protein